MEISAIFTMKLEGVKQKFVTPKYAPQNADTSKVERTVSWKNLERIIEKEKEIDSLNKIVKDVKIMQFEAIELDDSFSDTT